MAEFIKKPQRFTAFQYTGEDQSPLPEGVHPANQREYAPQPYVVTAHDQRVFLSPGDWVVKEPNGNGYYPIKDEVMKIIADPVEYARPPFKPDSETPGFIGTLEETGVDPASIPSSQKPLLTGLVRDDPKTPEGKYLVKRRDGTVVEWPQFVLGARDPFAEIALRAYADAVEEDIMLLGEEEAAKVGLTLSWVAGIRRHADTFHKYRLEHGNGDPGRGIHRKDDPVTILEMKKGYSA